MPFIQLIGGLPEPYRPANPPLVRVSPAVTETAPLTEHSLGGGVAVEAAYRHAEPAAEPVSPPQAAVLARQIMTTPVLTLPPEALLAEARDMIRRRRFRHIPVLSREGRLVGILSDRDLLRAGEARPGQRVAEVMSPRVLTATPDTAIREIARVLVHERIGCLPLVGPAGELVGILTTTDVLRCVVQHARLDLWV